MRRPPGGRLALLRRDRTDPGVPRPGPGAATWLDLETDPGAEALLRAVGVAPDETPVVIAHGSDLLRNPSAEQLARAGTSSRIENYLGFPAGLSGSDLAARATVQAEKFGARLTSPYAAAGLEQEGLVHVLTPTSGEPVRARAVVLATGARYRRLAIADLDRFDGTSVFYAATPSEASRCGDRAAVVVGGGNSAGQAAVFLAGRLPRVHLLVRRANLADTTLPVPDQPDRVRAADHRAGVFAVGDVRSGSTKRVAAAGGEGSQVVSQVHRYLAARFVTL